ncbi:hypothetical protein BLA18109_03184 [Burkholderia lata]|uniref:Uncharacterized protein n=1 Tax=Burkholderia lata (strain ATCC 17760 / DSM 23089 / LMG 22485 / NCIMB 9086 / R18194 / 383) TaxID=482957 RepID=A0A6P2USG7_BURL3|nr:hypothetical protein BLA18109_03184 [Burkholderia lata]
MRSVEGESGGEGAGGYALSRLLFAGRATTDTAGILHPAAWRRPACGTSAAVVRHSLGGGVFGRNSHSGSIAQCQHSGLRALHT